MTSLLTDVWHGATRIRFDAAQRRNAMTLVTVQAMTETLDKDPEAPVVIGSTDPGIFSAGADVTIDDDERRRVSDELYGCYRTMLARPGAVVAVVEGAAVGGGAQLTTAADLRIGGPHARWKWVGAGHGLVVGGWILPDLLGRAAAFDLMLTSRWVDADAAVRLGLLGDVHEDPWAAAAGLLEHLTGLSPDAVAQLKRLSLDAGLLDRLDAERRRNQDWDGRMPPRPRG